MKPGLASSVCGKWPTHTEDTGCKGVTIMGQQTGFPKASVLRKWDKEGISNEECYRRLNEEYGQNITPSNANWPMQLRTRAFVDRPGTPFRLQKSKEIKNKLPVTLCEWLARGVGSVDRHMVDFKKKHSIG